MKILADENLFEPIIRYLRQLNHYLLSIRDEGLSGIKDDEVYQIACKENRVIITMDKDFSRFFRFPAEKCGGIVIVKIYKKDLQDTLALFKQYFTALKEDDVLKNFVFITPEGIRIRKSEK